MKKTLFAIMAVAAMVSCNKTPVSEGSQAQGEDQTGRYVTKSVVFGKETTKALASFADEDKINDATIFVYQKNTETGTTIDYEVKYISGNSAEFQLYFSDQTVYTYSFAVWVNMGELTDEPVAGDIIFSDEKNDDLQMRGTKNNIGEADSETISIPVTRYVGKVMVSEINLDWKFKKNALKTFELLDIYVANSAETDAVAPSPAYNVNGVFTSTAMDGFLYDSMNQTVVADEGKYEQDHIFYAYETESTEIVIKAQLDGEEMYYHFPIKPEDNTFKSYKITIKQAGASEPLGELPEETIVVSTVTLSVEGWNNQEEGDIVFEKN